MQKLTKPLMTFFLVIFGINIAGCHTIRGFGEDLTVGGKAISKAAAKAENGNNKKTVESKKTKGKNN